MINQVFAMIDGTATKTIIKNISSAWNQTPDLWPISMSLHRLLFHLPVRISN